MLAHLVEIVTHGQGNAVFTQEDQESQARTVQAQLRLREVLSEYVTTSRDAATLIDLLDNAQNAPIPENVLRMFINQLVEDLGADTRFTGAIRELLNEYSQQTPVGRSQRVILVAQEVNDSKRPVPNVDSRSLSRSAAVVPDDLASDDREKASKARRIIQRVVSRLSNQRSEAEQAERRLRAGLTNLFIALGPPPTQGVVSGDGSTRGMNEH